MNTATSALADDWRRNSGDTCARERRRRRLRACRRCEGGLAAAFGAGPEAWQFARGTVQPPARDTGRRRMREPAAITTVAAKIDREAPVARPEARPIADMDEDSDTEVNKCGPLARVLEAPYPVQRARIVCVDHDTREISPSSRRDSSARRRTT